jgi:zinc protease
MMDLDRSIAPDCHAISNPTFVPISSYKLSNGMQVHTIDAASIDVMRLEFVFNAGSAFQNKLLQASMSNKMLLEGTKKYSSFLLAEAFDALGAYTDISVGQTKASLTVYTLNKHLSKVLDLVAEIFENVTFPKEEFDSELNQKKQGFLVESEKVSSIARRQFFENLFGTDHPYGIHADLKDFDQIGNSDLPEFFKNYYTFPNCNLFCSGKIPERFPELLQEKFDGDLGIGETHVFEYPQPITTGGTQFIAKEGAVQSAIRIGALMPDVYHKDYPSLKVLITVLGGYFGSRLMKNIREDKGFTYGIGASLQGLKGCGLFNISTEVGAASTKQALIEIYKEIERLKSDLVPEEELSNVKSYLLGQLLKSADGPMEQMDMFKGVQLHGLNQNYYITYMDTIRNIEAKDLKDLANRYLVKEEMVEVVVGAKE